MLVLIGSHPGLQVIEDLSGTAGVPVKTAANTWEPKSGKTASVVIGGTTLNFQAGVLIGIYYIWSSGLQYISECC